MDVEEYFQAEAAFAAGIRQEDWPSIAPRAAPCMDAILELLAEHNASATFFVLGWVARTQPEVVRRIARAGHPVASHGMNHQMLNRLDPQAFHDDLLESRKVLEDLCGRPVVGYRAPTFSVTRRTAWAVDVLAEAGFRYDSSVFPVRHDRYGVPDAPPGPHRLIGPGGGSILEIPPMTRRVMGSNLPLGGGGYLRLLPVRLFSWALRGCRKEGRPGLIYFHPWELDPGQPALPMKPLQRWRHRVGLSRTARKLRWLLQRFPFTAIEPSLDALAAADLPTFTLTP